MTNVNFSLGCEKKYPKMQKKRKVCAASPVRDCDLEMRVRRCLRIFLKGGNDCSNPTGGPLTLRAAGDGNLYNLS